MGKGKVKHGSGSYQNPNRQRHDGFGTQQNGLGNNQQNGLASQYDNRVAYQHDNQYGQNTDNNFHSQGGRAYGQKSNSKICLERVTDSERLLKYNSEAEWQSLNNLIEKAKKVCLAYDSNDLEKVKTLKRNLNAELSNFFEPHSQSSTTLTEDQLLDQFYDQLKEKKFQVERTDSIDARVRSIIGEFGGGKKGAAKKNDPNLVTFLELLDQI